MTGNKTFRISKWVMLSLAVVSNAFILFYSSLSNDTTYKLQRPFTNFFVGLINSFTKKEIEKISLESISASFSSDKYNDIPGYSFNEIPLGSAKEIVCSFLPIEATNKSISYKAEPSENVVLSQSGEKVSVVGMKTGLTRITATSSDGNYKSSVDVNVVETVAPTNFEISLENTVIQMGHIGTINFDINGGVLGHNELINFRYYDTRKLNFHSNDESIAIVDENGVIYPQSVGETEIIVSNETFSREISIQTTSGASPTSYSNLNISGDNICHGNDMILSQKSAKYEHQLIIKDGENMLNPDDFIWSSSNDLLVKVDKHGVMRGFRKKALDDENAIITAKSKITGQTATFNVVVKNQLPTKLDFYLTWNDTKYWNKETYTLSVGDVIEGKANLSPITQDKAVNVVSSNPDIISSTSEGDSFVLYVLKKGKTKITITSVINPELIVETQCTVVEAGSIATDDISNVGTYIRKSIGHADVFLVSEIFTFLALFMFLYEKRWWFYSSIAIGEGLLISSLSELIQYFVPTRTGQFIDVLINFGGSLVGFILAIAGVLLIKLIIKRKKEKEINNK